MQGGGAVCVAYSGGLDSTVLLHAMAQLVARNSSYRLRAAHIDHQLHADSGRWRAHCQEVAGALGVPLVQAVVDVSRDAESGLEAAAREARYGELRRLLEPGEVLLTAHHADDQLETLLLALMRGAGVRGLSAVPESQPFGPGSLVRPLLGFTRAELEMWAVEQRLRWISDPSNDNVDFDRNYLRHRVVPALRERWSAAALSAARSASHLGEALDVLDDVAVADVAAVSVGPCLSVDLLRTLDPARRRNVLRYWIRRSGARSPSTRKLAAIEHDMLAARADRVPCVDWDGREVRRHRGLLYCAPKVATEQLPEEIEWETGLPVELPGELGRLSMIEAGSSGIAAAKLAQPLRIRFRIGGETFQPAGDAHHRKLKKLLQSAGVLPWWRDRLPLIYSAGRLVAVGDLWIAAEFAASGGEPALAISWERRPQLAAVERGALEKNSTTRD